MGEKRMTPNEKVAYLKGLMAGLKLEDSTDDTAKVLKGIIDVLGDLAQEIDNVADYVDELDEEVAELGEIVDRIDDDLYDDDDDDDDDFFEDFDEDSEYYEVVCPKCGDSVCVSEEILLEGSIECPNCQKLLEFDFSTLTADDINDSDDEDSED